MRLICPNCDAKYEVPEEAIPAGGRDVQCSSCGHAWFQLRPDELVAAEEEAALFGDDLPRQDDTAPAVEPSVDTAKPPAGDAPSPPEEPAPDPQPEEHVTAAVPPGVEADPDTDAAIAALLTGQDDAPAAHAEAAPVRRDLDESVLAVLREEAEREAEARRIEAQRDGARRAEAEDQMHVQPELPVGETPAAISPTQRRLAMLKGKNPDAPPAEAMKPAARRDLLPDVEEINSTLQPGENEDLDAEIDALPDLTRRRGGFRSGFFLVILLMVIAAAVYMAAPKIAAQFPAMQGYLASYVEFIDGLRIWLNDLMKSATNSLNGSSG